MHPYASADYASAFSPLESIYLPHAKTHVLRRPIPGTDRFDAFGCYPLCVLEASDGLSADLELLRNEGLVSLVLVTDCLTQPAEPFLRAHFDVCREFKTHFTYDATLPNGEYSKHHRDRIRRARKSCETRVVSLSDYLPQWLACYETLVKRKGITGIQNFSRSYFEKLAEMPQATTIAAFAEEQFVSAHIWMRGERVLYAHLAASTELGYKLRSAFVIYDHAIQLFREDHVIDFGGGAGVEAGEGDGLAEFKRGFANGQRQNYLCGKILDDEVYQRLCADRGVEATTTFFPAYRAPTGAARTAP